MDKVRWGEKMRGLVEYIRAHTIDLWKPKTNSTWVVYQRPGTRYTIVRERQHNFYENPEAFEARDVQSWMDEGSLGRHEFFAEYYNHDISEEDALHFAKQLAETIWQETSYNDRRYIIAVLLKMQAEDDTYRADMKGYVPDPIASDEEMVKLEGPLTEVDPNFKGPWPTYPHWATIHLEEMWDNYIRYMSEEENFVDKEGKSRIQNFIGNVSKYKRQFMEAQKGKFVVRPYR